MLRLSKIISATVVLVSFANLGTAFGQEPIRFARTPDISPDGKQVAFSYLGDIWTVETIGGIARPVTMHEAHDIAPCYSPDGRLIAFSSNRFGSYDVFVVSAQGGKPRRLTFDSAADMVCGWSPDGKQVLFASNRGTEFPVVVELYTVPAEGGRARRITAAEGREGVFSPRGDQLAYVRGQGTWYRRGYRGSSNDDIWVCNADGTNHRRLTSFVGEDFSPMWSGDGQTIYYVSEVFSTTNPAVANIVKQDVAGRNPPQMVTHHTEDTVRKARISANGEWIVYECGADLWVVSTKEPQSPRKLAIEVHADDKTNTEKTLTLTKGMSEYALSPDEKYVAFAVHGELFLMPTQPNAKVTRLTKSPSFDHAMAWSPDMQKLVFASDRNGHEDLYLLEGNDPEHKKFVEAHIFKVTQLTNTAEAEIGVSFTPDGKRIAFLRAGQLFTMKPDGSDQKALVSDKIVIDYEWSPDGKWVAFSRMDGSFASEIYIMPISGGEAKNVTRYATHNSNITWSANGKKLAFISLRRRTNGMHVLSLQRPAIQGAPSSSEIDWEDIHLRTEQAAPIGAEEGAISTDPDASKVAFRSSGPQGDDLWVASTNGSSLSRITTGNLRPHQIQWSKRSPDTIYFLDGEGIIRKANSGAGDFASMLTRMPGSSGLSGQAAALNFKIKLTIQQDEEFGEIFEQSWRHLTEHFYDPKFHGIDMEALRNKYRPLVKHIALREDLYALISLMMGELNASHLGIYGFAKGPEELTADLGLIFDETYSGPGVKISEILKRGPADKRGLNLKAGDIITAIDGTYLDDKVEISKLLNGKVDEPVSVQILTNPNADPKDPKARRQAELTPVSRDKIQHLMYDRWVQNNAKRITELSKGKLGYIHIPSMDETGLEAFVRSLYSDNFDKEAIVLDVRYNGGGFTHDQVLNYLGGREHTTFRQRDGGEGLVLSSFDRKWTKPLVLLINNQSYSDAEIFPNAFRTLGLGKLVGQPTGGHVIGTSSVRLIDGSLFRIPRTGVYTAKGVNMEKEGVSPDFLVEPTPDQVAKGIDPQIEKAVEVVMQDVTQWKKAHPLLAGNPEDGKPATPIVGPVVPLPAGK
ncbi:MAG TPA: S41 family peptidase [Gemmataceae bacterium]|nr:S41 family peptidase [Gemmataceae bacterium]